MSPGLPGAASAELSNALVAALFAVVGPPARAQGYSINWHKVAGGGGTSA